MRKFGTTIAICTSPYAIYRRRFYHLRKDRRFQTSHHAMDDTLYCMDCTVTIKSGWKEFFFFTVNSFIFYNNLSEIVYNKTINWPWHDSKSFFVCDMSFKFVTTMIHRSNISCCACVRLKHASHTRKTVQPLWNILVLNLRVVLVPKNISHLKPNFSSTLRQLHSIIATFDWKIISKNCDFFLF